jgi:hypothetical protein
MIFKNIALETEVLGVENFEDLKNIVSDECKINDAPLMDVIDNDNNINNENNNNSSENNNNIISTSSNKAPKKKNEESVQK